MNEVTAAFNRFGVSAQMAAERFERLREALCEARRQDPVLWAAMEMFAIAADRRSRWRQFVKLAGLRGND